MDKVREYPRDEDDINTCPAKVVCPTSEREMDSLKKDIDTVMNHYKKLREEIWTNRKFDIAILLVGLLSFIVNIARG